MLWNLLHSTTKGKEPRGARWCDVQERLLKREEETFGKSEGCHFPRNWGSCATEAIFRGSRNLALSYPAYGSSSSS